jgi:hypothetical protein
MVLPLLAAALTTSVATVQDFNGSGGTAYELDFKESRRGRPISGGKLLLLNGFQSDTSSSIGFEKTSDGLHSSVEVTFDLEISTGREGIGFALLDTATHGDKGKAPKVDAWEEPNIAKSFGIGFDISNPPTKHWFDGNGNVYGRPEREISLHWDGIEVFNKRSELEFRDTGSVPVKITIEETTGGSLVTVQRREQKIYDEQFIAEMHPYESRAAFGGRTSGPTAEASIDNLLIKWSEPTKAPAKPIRVKVMDKAVVNSGKQTTAATAQFPEDTSEIGRAILTLSLGETPQGMDEWDRRATIRIYDEEGQPFELVRYMTPFERSYTWKVDVTDYLPLLKGERKIDTWIETWTQGFAVSIDIDLYPGPSQWRPTEIRNLWNGYWEIGNDDKPFSKSAPVLNLSIPENADRTKLRITATGHGMSPNRDNAAEFMPIRRWIDVNGTRKTNLLWTTDPYLNPVRPQGGTWKFDRAGWGPGTVCRPWEIDASNWVEAGKKARIEYILDDWKNTTRNPGYPAAHMFASQIVFYERR